MSDLFVYIQQKSGVYIPINLEYLEVELNDAVYSAENHLGVFCNKALGIYIEGIDSPSFVERLLYNLERYLF